MIAIFFIAIWGGVFFRGTAIHDSVVYNNSMPLFAALEYLVGTRIWISNIIAAAICAILIFLIGNLNTIHFFLNERTFLPSLIFILITAIFPEFQTLNPALLASFFMIIALRDRKSTRLNSSHT